MIDLIVSPGLRKHIGLASDHGGFELKEQLKKMLQRLTMKLLTLVILCLTRMMTIPIMLCP